MRHAGKESPTTLAVGYCAVLIATAACLSCALVCSLQVVNFKFIPPPLQVPTVNVAIMGWSCFLALKANETPGGDSAADAKKAVVRSK